MKTAKDLEGFLLKIPFNDQFVFRIYDKEGKFIDYQIRHMDLKIKLLDGFIFFDEEKQEHYIDYRKRK